MAMATMTSRGQMTFRKDVLQHMGIQPGEKVEIAKMPNGRIELHRSERTGSIEDLCGILKGKSKKIATLEEIEKAIQDGWAGKR
jgi:antitoxin PrlF